MSRVGIDFNFNKAVIQHRVDVGKRAVANSPVRGCLGIAWPFGPQIMLPIRLIGLIEATITVGKKSYIYPKSKKGNHISLAIKDYFLSNQIRRKKIWFHHIITLCFICLT